MVTSKQLRLAVEAEEERRARLEDAATKRLRLAMEMDKESKARLEKMVATRELIYKYSVHILLSERAEREKRSL